MSNCITISRRDHFTGEMVSGKNYYYDINRRYLSAIGQWPSQKPKEKLSILILLMTIVAIAVTTQVSNFRICEDTECILETIPPYMLALMVLVKVLTYQFNGQKIKDLTDHLFVDWDMFETREEHEIMRRYAENGRWYALIYGSYLYVSTTSFASISLVPRILDVVSPLNTSRPIIWIYPAYYYVDEERYYYYIFFHMLFNAWVGLTAVIAHDCMFFTYVEHVCGLFAVVGFTLEDALYKRNNATKAPKGRSDYMYHKIVFSFHVHHKALQFAKLLESTFTVSFAVQIMMATVGMSISLLQLSTQLHDLTEAIRYVVFIVAQWFHLFCLSFQGQKLIDHSLETRDRIYNGTWYQIPAKKQKLLLMVMRKSIEASSLTAGKIYTFSLQSFTTVLQTSMSYFTVLSSFNES